MSSESLIEQLCSALDHVYVDLLAARHARDQTAARCARTSKDYESIFPQEHKLGRSRRGIVRDGRLVTDDRRIRQRYKQAKRVAKQAERRFKAASRRYDEAYAKFEVSCAYLMGVPTPFLTNVRVVQKYQDGQYTHHVYFGGQGGPLGPQHGHYVMAANGQMLYRRNPLDPHGAQNHCEPSQAAHSAVVSS